jgi:hypothetical protein
MKKWGGRHSDASKELMRIIGTGRTHTNETKKKLSDSHKGKPTWNKGKEFSDESKEKMRAAKIGVVPWNKGNKKVKEIKEKTKKEVSLETKKKLSISHIGIAVGNKNGMFGKSVYNLWVEKYGEKEAIIRAQLRKEKSSASLKGRIPWNKSKLNKNV